ncbi:MAG: Nif3-like dinuclear metal center hexameric protein [Clostridia bacterium]|nr:Nif3-like dinuclear metal center hexameric protein [Clostridia bacterium]
MKISDVLLRLENYAPIPLAEEYDNVGLMVGDADTSFKAALLTLDVDINVAEEAKKCGANLIISHHPLIFSPLKRITSDTAEGQCLLYLIKNNIAVYSAHTNLDSAAGGLNDLLAAILGLQDVSPLSGEDTDTGIGRVGCLPAPLTMDGLSRDIMKKFALPAVRFTGEGDDLISRVALCTGGGASLIDEAVSAFADVYITGDIKYHNAREACERGINLIELSHYDSEIIVTRLFKRILGDDIKTYISEANKNVFSTLVNNGNL